MQFLAVRSEHGLASRIESAGKIVISDETDMPAAKK